MKTKQKQINGKDQAVILEGCCQNDRHSQELLYRGFFPTMERMVRRYTQDDDQVIDILNNGFLRVFKKIDTFRNEGSLEGWIRKLIFHSVSDYFRSKKKDVKFLLYDEAPEIAQKANTDLYFEDLMKFVHELPDKHQKVFHLYAIEGFIHREIGQQLGMSENTSKWYLSEARKLLQKKIDMYYTMNRYAAK